MRFNSAFKGLISLCDVWGCTDQHVNLNCCIMDDNCNLRCASESFCIPRAKILHILRNLHLRGFIHLWCTFNVKGEISILMQYVTFVYRSFEKAWRWLADSFIHLVVCLTTGPKPLPKRALHIVRSRASSFKWEYPLLSLRSSSSFLRLLPRLPVTSISPFIFP